MANQDNDRNTAPGAENVADDALLERFFEAARGDFSGGEAEMPSDLFARVLDDAYAVQENRSEAVAVVPVPAAPPAPEGWLASLWGTIGGAPGLAGLASAVAVGLWFGGNPPEPVSDLTSALIGTGPSVEASEDGFLDYDPTDYELAYANLLVDG